MAWIKTIPYEESEGKLKSVYDKIKGDNNYIDNIMQVHSLRPNSLEGHMSLYKNALHHKSNVLPKWLLEAIGVYVSLLNNCTYCVAHHFSGMSRNIKDDFISNQIMLALESDAPDLYFIGKELAMMDYVRELTLTPERMTRKSVSLLKVIGIPDGQILEINQAVAYFAYANRTVLGLGVNTEDEIIGLSPNNDEDPNDWSHH
jgi:uncharacterized peroxidase-related enzyme